MAIYLPKEKIAEIFATYGGSATNTGSTEGQVALFTYRIEQLSKHLQTNKQDHSCRRALLALVGQRKRFLAYLHDADINRYRAICEKLGIRHT
jgi:small subunit ribosomal protein S15